MRHAAATSITTTASITTSITTSSTASSTTAHLHTTPTAVSNEYFCELDANGLRRDRLERPELTLGTVEFVAPAEYMVRPPQPPAFLF